jgi:hypothetical protein
MRKGLWTQKSYRRAEFWTGICSMSMFIFIPIILVGYMLEIIWMLACYVLKKKGAQK